MTRQVFVESLIVYGAETCNAQMAKNQKSREPSTRTRISAPCNLYNLVAGEEIRGSALGNTGEVQKLTRLRCFERLEMWRERNDSDSPGVYRGFAMK